MEHASDNWAVAAVSILLSLIILYAIIFAQRKGPPNIRRIAGLSEIDDAVGRATEMGRPVLMVPGIGGLDVISLQALSLFGYIARSVARFGNKSIIPTIDPLLTAVAEETLRDSYTEAGRPELFSSDDVRYLSQQQFAFAIGVSGILIREKVAASFLFGTFAAESLILAEIGNQVGAIQVAGTPSTTQVPFLIAACDYVIIGEEYYAATAYVSKEPTLLGSLVGQDYCKLILAAIAVVGCLLKTIEAAHRVPPPPTGFYHWVDVLLNLFRS